MDIHLLPKVELHLHLDCSLSYTVASRIDPSIRRKQYQDTFIAPPKCANLADYLTRTINPIRLMQTEENLALVVKDLFEQLRRDNVIYAEIRFAPLLHVQQQLSPQAVVRAVDAATQEACQATGIEARLILCTLRHFTEEQGLQTVKLIEQFSGTHVAALDIAADEMRPIGPHIKAFQYAHAAGIPCTAHGGEARGPESVWEIMRNLSPSRLGHGIRSIEDPALIDYLREHRIHLEVCPTSNIQTNVYPAYPDHTINRLFDAGLSLSINTDARAISNITLDQEYENVQRIFGWDQERFLKSNQNALHAAFIPEELKLKLSKKLLTNKRMGNGDGNCEE